MFKFASACAWCCLSARFCHLLQSLCVVAALLLQPRWDLETWLLYPFDTVYMLWIGLQLQQIPGYSKKLTAPQASTPTATAGTETASPSCFTGLSSIAPLPRLSSGLSKVKQLMMSHLLRGFLSLILPHCCRFKPALQHVAAVLSWVDDNKVHPADIPAGCACCTPCQSSAPLPASASTAT